MWPVIHQDGRSWREPQPGYADALRRLSPGVVTATSESTDNGVQIELNTGALLIHPAKEEIFVEIAGLSGFPDGRWMTWRPGEDSFEDLA